MLLVLGLVLPASATWLARVALEGTLCPLAAAALAGCWVDCNRWIQPHFLSLLLFLASRWTVEVLRPVCFSPLWPASWVAAVGKTRTSRTAEVREI